MSGQIGSLFRSTHTTRRKGFIELLMPLHCEVKYDELWQSRGLRFRRAATQHHIVVADEVEVVVAVLNTALDLVEERHALLGGGIETVAFEHPKIQKNRHSRIRSPQARRSLEL